MIVAETTGVTLAQADEVRRALGTPAGPAGGRGLVAPGRARPAATRPPTVDRIWEVLKAFASFGFCKAHAAAFALPTYQSAWLKTHHPAAFLAGVLTHDPGMYPKRLILDDARGLGIAVLGPRRQRLDRHLPHRAGLGDARTASGSRARADAVSPGIAVAGHRLRPPLRPVSGLRAPRPARRPGLRHPALPGRRQGHQRRRGRADRRRPALRQPRRLLAPGPRQPARSSSGSCWPAGSTPSTASAGSQGAGRGDGRSRPPRAGHPARPAAPRRRARPVVAVGHRARSRLAPRTSRARRRPRPRGLVAEQVGRHRPPGRAGPGGRVSPRAPPPVRGPGAADPADPRPRRHARS